MSFGFTELILVALFILLIFGAKRIPELARALGRASFEFKKAKTALNDESKEFLNLAENSAKNTEVINTQIENKTENQSETPAT